MRPTVFALAACSLAAAVPDASEVQTRLGIDAKYTDTVSKLVENIATDAAAEKVGRIDAELLLWATVRTWIDTGCNSVKNEYCSDLKSFVEYLVREKRASSTKIINWSQESTLGLLLTSFTVYLSDDSTSILKTLYSAVDNPSDCNGWETPKRSLHFAFILNIDSAKTLLMSPCTKVDTNSIISSARTINRNDELVKLLLKKASASDVEVAVADPDHGEYIERLLEQTDYPEKDNIIKIGKTTRASLSQTIKDIGLREAIRHGDSLVYAIARLDKITHHVHALIEHLDLTRGIYDIMSLEALQNFESPFTKYVIANFPRILPMLISNFGSNSTDYFPLIKRLLEMKEMANISPATACEIATEIVPLGMTLKWHLWPEYKNTLPGLWDVMISVFRKFNFNQNVYKMMTLPNNEVYYAAFLLAVHDQAAFDMMTEDDVRAFLHKHRRVIKKMMLPVGSTEDARTFIVDGVNDMKGIKKHESTVKPPVLTVPRPNTKSNGTRSLEKCMSAVHAAVLVLALALIF